MFEAKVKILVIDDRSENLHAMKITLAPLENVEMYTAQSGNDGLALMLDHEFAVVLLDVQMPGMDGFETAELMQSHDVTRNIPIIFITAISKEDKHVFKGYKSGAVDYLFKPLDPDILLSKVNVFVKLYQQRVEFEWMQEEFQKKKNLEALGVLAGGIAHDFNNLLTTVFGNIQLAQMQCYPESKIYQQLGESVEGIHEAMKLTRQMITFSKGGRPMMEKVNIAHLLKAVTTQLLSSSNVQVHFDIPPSLDKVKIDKLQIRQVFQNLLLNAKEAMLDSGNLAIKLENINIESDNFEPSIKSGEYVRITFKDDGPGIDPTIIDMIFDPYFSSKSKGETKGQGLGLAIVHSILLKHGGYIFAESNPGEGATFSIYLPVTTIQDQQTEKPEGSHPTPSAKPSSSIRKRILVLENDKSLVKAFKKMLEHLGYDAIVVDNGPEAIELFKQAWNDNQSYDAVILELAISYRGEEGDILARLQEVDPEVRAFITSSSASNPIMVNCKSYGFVQAINKPFSLNDLKEAVKEII